MKVCLLCGETYSDPIDFCFRDGEVLSSADARQTPTARARTESYSATPGLVTAAAMVAEDEPEVTRANRRALMRAAAAAYVVTDPPGAEIDEHGANGSAGAPTPLLVSPLDQGMPELPWPLEEEALPEDHEEPARGSMFAAALIGALVVVAAALGAGLIVLVGLGQRDAPPTGTLPVTARPAARVERDVGRPAYDAAPTPRPVSSSGQVDPSRKEGGLEPVAPGPAGEAAAASEFRVVLGAAGADGSRSLVLYVDGAPAGALPATVRLTPGEHTFRVATEPSGTAMLEVRRTVERPHDPTVAQTIDLAE